MSDDTANSSVTAHLDPGGSGLDLGTPPNRRPDAPPNRRPDRQPNRPPDRQQRRRDHSSRYQPPGYDPSLCSPRAWALAMAAGNEPTTAGAAEARRLFGGISTVFRDVGAGNCSAVAWHPGDSTSPVVLALSGTWCTYTVQQGSTRLLQWVRMVDSTVVVDLQGVEFCDGRAITLLLEMRRLSLDRGRLMRFRRPSRCVTRLFEICDLAGLLETEGPKPAVESQRDIQGSG